ncbi:MAG TPA: hypothetical protein ENL03_03810 [Phycisphaerae bacterium]|nr:hypothetical protein [Phycisphaerae bacterium]
MLFSNYWASSSLCSPSRACALTGRYPQSIGVAGLCHAPENYHLSPGVKHLSHIMRDSGRRTALVGWPVWEFYDLQADPLERSNLSVHPPVDHASDHQEQVNQLWQDVPHQPEIEATLRRRLLDWMQRIGDPILDGIPPCEYDMMSRKMLWDDGGQRCKSIVGNLQHERWTNAEEKKIQDQANYCAAVGDYRDMLCSKLHSAEIFSRDEKSSRWERPGK